MQVRLATPCVSVPRVRASILNTTLGRHFYATLSPHLLPFFSSIRLQFIYNLHLTINNGVLLVSTFFSCTLPGYDKLATELSFQLTAPVTSVNVSVQ